MSTVVKILFVILCFGYVVGPVLIATSVGLFIYGYIVTGFVSFCCGVSVLFVWLMLRKTKFIGG